MCRISRENTITLLSTLCLMHKPSHGAGKEGEFNLNSLFQKHIELIRYRFAFPNCHLLEPNKTHPFWLTALFLENQQNRTWEKIETSPVYVCLTVFLNNGKKITFHSDPSFSPKNQTGLYNR